MKLLAQIDFDCVDKLQPKSDALSPSRKKKLKSRYYSH